MQTIVNDLLRLPRFYFFLFRSCIFHRRFSFALAVIVSIVVIFCAHVSIDDDADADEY